MCYADGQTINIPQREYSVANTQKPFWLNISSDAGLVYSSNKPSVATVSADGKVTIHGKGTATITVSAKNDPKRYESIHVKVSAHKKTSGKMAESVWDYDKKPGES